MTDRKILIVEDEFIIAADLKMTLKSYGYTVCDIIDKGEDVINVVKEKKPDIVLMDINLKGKMSGIDAAANLYNNNYNIPIIYISAEINAERLNKINIPNTYGFLIKPLREDTLYTTIEITAGKYELEEKLKVTNIELEKTNENLERTNAELEETIDELKQTNEELEATNEELASTNEELEATNEELASTNEELEATNEELEITYQELKQSEQSYRLLFSKMVSAFAYHKIICDENNKPIDYIFLEFNEAFEKFTGLTRDIIGKNVTEVFPNIKEDNSNLINIYGEVALTGKSNQFETYFEPLKKWYLITVYSPQKEFFVVIFDDITERKRTEEQLKQERYLFKLITETAPVGITIINTDGYVNFANPSAERILGLKREEIFKRTYNDPEWRIVSLSGEPFPNEQLPFNIVMRTGEAVYGVQHAIEWPNGKSVIISINAAPMKDEAGNIINVIASLEDITHLREVEKTNQQTLNTLLSLIKYSPNFISLFDKDGKYYLVSDSLASFFDKNAIDLQGKYLTDFLPLEMVDVFRTVAQKVFDTKKPLTIVDPTKKDTKNRIFESTSFPIFDENGEITLLGAISNDITERELAKEALVKEKANMNLILSSLNTGFSLINPDLTIEWVNDTIRKMFPNKEPKNKICYEFYENRTLPCENCFTIKAFETGQKYEVEKLNPLNGLWYRIVSIPIIDDTGQVVNVLESITDITENKKISDELQLRNSIIETIYKNFPTLMLYQIIRNKDGKRHFTFVSESVKYLYGCTPEEAMADSNLIYGKVAEDYRDKVIEEEEKAFINNTKFSMEVKIIDPSGKIRWSQFTSMPTKMPDGTTLWNGFEVDITDQKKIEEELHRNQVIFDAFLENSPIYVFFKDSEIRVLKISKNYEKMLGMPIENVIGKTMFDLFPSDLAKSMVEDDKKILKEEKLFTVIEELGGKIYETIKYPIIINENEKLLAGFTIDITDRKKLEKSLIENEEKYKSLAENSPDHIMRFDEDCRHLYVNKALIEEIGLPYEQHIGKMTRELGVLPEDACNIWEQCIKDVFKTKKEQNNQLVVTTKKGNIAYFDVKFFPEFSDNGEVKSVVLVSRNITYIKEMENKLKEYINRLENSNKELETFAYRLSHDLKNPLLNVISALRIISSNIEKTPDEEAILNSTMKKVENMTILIDDLLNYSILSQKNQLEEVNLNHIIMELKNKEYDLYCENLPTVKGTKSLLRTLFQNLIDNAVKYCKMEKPIIYIKVEEKQNEWIFSVKDNGIGIKAEDKDKIFQMLYRASDIKKEYAGIGIGLAICKKIVEIHNGRIWVESEVGEGSIFYFTIQKT